MSFSVQAEQIIDITNRWELAQRISGHAKAPEEALKSVFTGVMQELEVMTKTKFETAMKDRVWNAVSTEELKILKETFILEFCEKNLGNFNEEEANIMLKEHKRTGAVKNILYSAQLLTTFALNKSSIFDTVAQKAGTMAEAWIPKIIDAVRGEGIQFSEPNKI